MSRNRKIRTADDVRPGRAAVRGSRCRDRESDERAAITTLNAANAVPVLAAATIAAPDPQIAAVVRLTIWIGSNSPPMM